MILDQSPQFLKLLQGVNIAIRRCPPNTGKPNLNPVVCPPFPFHLARVLQSQSCHSEELSQSPEPPSRNFAFHLVSREAERFLLLPSLTEYVQSHHPINPVIFVEYILLGL